MRRHGGDVSTWGEAVNEITLLLYDFLHLGMKQNDDYF